MSGFYLDGVRQKERFDNEKLIDQLEAKFVHVLQSNTIEFKSNKFNFSNHGLHKFTDIVENKRSIFFKIYLPY
ncbi:4-hydroxy-3-methylbut-2-en-1-yl diphosphate synthase [Actinobacillus equuli]|nr:4-hydroxy-3-methylbut-2-en-1-yl diphosphate synthase [Actinobacillus equuli]